MSRTRVAILVALAVAVVGAAVALRSCGGGEEAVTPVAAVAPPAPRPTAAAETRARRGRAVGEQVAPGPAVAAPETLRVVAAPGEGTTGVSIEVVDEDGVRVREGAVRFELGSFDQYLHPGVDAFLGRTLHEKSLAAANPVVLRDLAKDTDGLAIQASARVANLPPTAPAILTIRVGKIETARLVAARPQTATVIVVDQATDLPVANARVVSVTELERRRVDPETVRGATAPGAAVTGADGRCALRGLGLGEHAIEVHADRYVRSDAKWTSGELRVRLEPQRDGATVTVRVLGPGGVRVPNVRVNLVGTDRSVKSDASGSAEFQDVSPHIAMFSLDVLDWMAAVRLRKWKVADPRRMTHLEIDGGGTYEAILGVPPAGTACIDGRLVDDAGSPISHVKLTVSDVGNAGASAETDDTGNAVFAELPKGSYGAHLFLDAGVGWFFEDVELADGARVSQTWTLGAITIRGRVVAGAERRGVSGVCVWFRGESTGTTMSGTDGRFELPHARAGTYEIAAKSETAATSPRTVTIPSDGDVVVELVEFGRVAVRFFPTDRPQLRDAEFRLYAAGDDDSTQPLRPGTGDDDLAAANVLPGHYEVQVSLAGRRARFPVEVKSGAASVVEVRVP